MQIPELGISLGAYHRQNGASETDVEGSRVVYVKRPNEAQFIAHLSRRLSPCLTMELLASLAEDEDMDASQKQCIQSVFSLIRQNLDNRLKESTELANAILKNVYRLATQTQPLYLDGVSLPAARLLAKDRQVIKKTGEVRYHGCAKVGETKFGCLNLLGKDKKYPDEVRRCLEDISKKNQISLELDSYRTQEDLPENALERQRFWHTWAEEGIKTVLIVMPWSPNERKQRLRIDALQAGIATQFIVPKPKADAYKAMNVVLGLLCKAGWQPVHLEPPQHPEAADLIIGFDTGTNRQLYYGTSAFAVLADGQSLGWELPDVQRGETFSGEGIWQTVSKLVLKFQRLCNTLPKKVLLMRDGLVQEGEFQPTIQNLAESGIAVDVVSVRKSGNGRMGILLQNEKYQDAAMGSTLLLPEERTFMMVTSQSLSKNLGSARPLRVVHEYGNTSLELLALQTYQLTQLHPASGFRACRLPWVLHLADRSSKEFQRIGQISILQNISREKLIAV